MLFAELLKKTDRYTRVTVEIPGLRTRRASLKFTGIRPRVRRAAVNADITFAVAHRSCSIDVSMKAEDEQGHRQSYQLVLQDLPHAVMSPPDSYYEVRRILGLIWWLNLQLIKYLTISIDYSIKLILYR